MAREGWSMEKEAALRAAVARGVPYHEALGGRRSVVEDCATCEEHGGGIMPPHDASPRCESGGRTHCSCDTCF